MPSRLSDENSRSVIIKNTNINRIRQQDVVIGSGNKVIFCPLKDPRIKSVQISANGQGPCRTQHDVLGRPELDAQLSPVSAAFRTVGFINSIG